MEEEIAGFLKEIPVQSGEKALIGVGGTVTTLVTLLQNIPEYDSEKVHGYSFSRKALEDLTDQLFRSTLRERLSMPGLPPGRADVIPAGSAILLSVMGHFEIPACLVSVYNLMHALAFKALNVRETTPEAPT